MSPRVAFIVLDAFPPDAVDAEVTPTLHALAEEGRWWPEGGPGVLPALTYPAHATFVTGRDPVDHGLVANDVWIDGDWRKADDVGPSVPTLFDAIAAGNKTSVAVVGDHHLINVCGATAATRHWPPDGRFPDGYERSITGYLQDTDAAAAFADHDPTTADFVFVQLDEVDAIQHVFGPGSDEALERHHRTDAALGSVLSALRPVWEELVVCVVSDHHQEATGDDVVIDPSEQLPEHLRFRPQGTVGVVVGDDPADLAALPGIAGTISMSDDVHLLWGEAGTRIGPTPYSIPGDHGSPRSARQLAVVGGGHPAVADVVSRVDAAGVVATCWAPLIADLLGVREHLTDDTSESVRQERQD